MAEGKNIINVYRDWITIFDKLTNEEAGILIKHFFKYVNDLNPEPPDRITELCFEPIKQQLKRDLIRWEKTCERNKNNGSKGGRPKNQDEPQKPSGLFKNPKNPNEPDKDKDTGKDIKYTRFYDLEIEKSKELNITDYPYFVAWLFENNINKKPLTKVLNMSDQITSENFKKYIDKFGIDKVKNTILQLENYNKKTYKSFNLTLNNWLK